MTSLILMLFLSDPALAKKPLNSNIYVQDEDAEKAKSYTAKVRVVRDISDELEVFFEGDDARGAFVLPRSIANFGSLVKILENSKKSGQAVTFTADADKRIKSVVMKESSATQGYTPPEDPDKAWDFEKAAKMLDGK